MADGQFSVERWDSWDAPVNFPAGIAKLRDSQIANRSTWGVVPDRDMTKAAQHIVRVIPGNAYTLCYVNELDPGISEESVGEGRGWQVAPRGYGNVVVHGRALR